VGPVDFCSSRRNDSKTARAPRHRLCVYVGDHSEVHGGSDWLRRKEQVRAMRAPAKSCRAQKGAVQFVVNSSI